jgi:hypothetical protein
LIDNIITFAVGALSNGSSDTNLSCQILGS